MAIDSSERLVPLDSSVGDEGLQLRARLTEACLNSDKMQASISGMLLQIHDKGFWQKWGYKSFGEFIRHECPFGVRKAEQLLRVRRVFVRFGLASDQIDSLPWSKAAVVAPLVKLENLNDMLEAIKSESFRDLRKMVRTISRGMASAKVVSKLELMSYPNSGANNENPKEASMGEWPLPSEDEFYVDRVVWRQMCFALHSGQQVLLVGEAGCGKSELVYRLAQAAERPLQAFNFGGMSEPRSALIGNTHLDKKQGTYFRKSRFVSAVTTPGTCVLLDELTRSTRDAFNIILPLLDTQGYLSLDESEDASVINRAEGINIFATANIGSQYTGTGRLDQALLDRFSIVIELDFPPMEQELRLLLNRCRGLHSQDASRLLEIVQLQRQQAKEGDFISSISTRSLIAAGNQMAAGFDLETAVKFTMLARFSGEGGDVSERARLGQIVSRFTPAKI